MTLLRGGYGELHKNYPGTDGNAPLVISSSQFIVHVHSDESNKDWGYKITATPTYPDISKSSNVSAIDFKVIESPPYYPNVSTKDKYEPVQFPGAVSCTIVFDPQSSLKTDTDFVRFYKDESYSTFWGEEKYT